MLTRLSAVLDLSKVPENARDVSGRECFFAILYFFEAHLHERRIIVRAWDDNEISIYVDGKESVFKEVEDAAAFVSASLSSKV